MNRVFLSLGSNIRPEYYLPQAVHLLSEHGLISGKSSVWQSKPVGYPDQADFLNAAVLMETACEASELFSDVIPGIESQLNRVRDPENKNGPRTIDIDLVLFNEERFQIGHRIIPDPDIVDRDFLAIPLAELAPDFCIPGLDKNLAQIASELKSVTDAQLIRRVDVRL
ncbi:2-amino-4-hydroxy-6-hydroxymethyldihydropteridine diphosphokinase [uncultured Gimesia sp.]|uniref:2-amino-4-hydroxy-6- hydroxymethyldihydropteridine diphosphokinase n=1 Tax=uncultured Gimesia sp. TaxID=1678688 RepID=UPI00262FE1D8|nr:2-amino-4-hydroxy-6-hydroxymethyldihydropteridine diphosphokinase [uncultured Gimesia sp.]